MTHRFLPILRASVLLAACSGSAGEPSPLTLVGWEIDAKNPDEFIARAEAVGFRDLISWSTDPVFLQKAVEAGRRHGVRVYSCISPMGGLASLWTKQYPDEPVPWQVMTEDEEAARTFISAGRNRYIIPYQFGGEPKMANEVLETKIVCLRDRRARELLERLIDGIVSVPGLEGLAFDGFGFQNYRRCYCDPCKSAFGEYCRAHQDLKQDEAEVVFFREALVGCINQLADYARTKRADIRTTIHIWPVFSPEPLYGNRLDVDSCGQTAAWYTLWPEPKIAEYSRAISGGARTYHRRQEGVGMIGYYDKPGEFPVKDAARVDMELRTMIENGCRSVQVCGCSDVLGNEAVSAVFRKYFGAAPADAQRPAGIGMEMP